MKSARNQTIQATTKTEWKKTWLNDKATGEHLRGITQALHIKDGPTLYNTMANRMHMAWLARLRTGHVSLNAYLHDHGHMDNPQCECGAGAETVSHYLLRCATYDEERDKLRKEVGFGSMRVGRLLGDPKNVKRTLDFVTRTQRFTFE